MDKKFYCETVHRRYFRHLEHRDKCFSEEELIIYASSIHSAGAYATVSLCGC
jgi:hypothetical protein